LNKRLAEEHVQSIDDRITAAEYSEKYDIKIAGITNVDISELKARKKKLEKMTPEQLRDMLVKELEHAVKPKK